MNRPAPDPAFRPTYRHLALGALLFLGPRIGTTAPNPADAAETPRPFPVARELAALVSRPEFARATWGVSVFDLATSRSLFATNEHRLLKPASTAKLFTAALALDAFGPDHRFRTELVPTGPLDRNGTLHGDLVVRGHGDFSCSARFHAGDPDRAMEAIVEALSRAGVRRIQGALVADVAAFPTPPFGNGWTADDLQYSYGAPVGALNADDNALDLVLHPGTRPGDPLRLVATPPTTQLTFDLAGTSTVATNGLRALELQRDPGRTRVRLRGTLPLGGAPWTESMAIPDPARHFVERATRALERHGIQVREPIAHSGFSAAPKFTRHSLPALTLESPPLGELIAGALKPSQNQYSQLLLLQVGQREEPKQPGDSLESAGLRALRSFVTRLGIPPSEVLLDDGSGLSRSGLVTPDALVQLLRHLASDPRRAPLMEALPIAGLDGTLRQRLRDTEAAGNLRAKTGSLRYVSGLSGFITNADGHRLAFAALLNAYDPPAGAASGRQALDELALILARSR